MQEWRNSIANTLELCLSCTNSSISFLNSRISHVIEIHWVDWNTITVISTVDVMSADDLATPTRSTKQLIQVMGLFASGHYYEHKDVTSIGNPMIKLTHWGWDKIAISQTTFSNAFSWMKMYEFCLRFHWSLFLRFELTIFQHWFW